MTDAAPVISVRDLIVEYGRGEKKVRALDGISFNVMPGECVGFIGANGAGKTTTIKILMGFIFPRKGDVRVFGERAGTVASRRRIGYLPEVALYYPFMKARELLELYGGLSGLSRGNLKEGIPPLLEKVGLVGKSEILLKNYSKGMQQRLGIAQAIIADPEALIFDELSTGLDPIGRFDLRSVLLNLKRRGRTIFFSSHELTEVEALCDRVIIIHKGRIVTEATVGELKKPLNLFEVVFSLPEGAVLPTVVAQYKLVEEGNLQRIEFNNVEEYCRVVSALASAGAVIHHTSSRTRTLEEYFIGLVETIEGVGDK
jgi:ABC-2 type transport system ATP-binding protein